MHRVDGLERPHHHLELGDDAVVVARDDVDAVDVLTFDRGFEFEHGVMALQDRLDVAELAGARFGRLCFDVGIATERSTRSSEVQHGDVATLLRGEHDRRQEDNVRVKHRLEAAVEVAFEVQVPIVHAAENRIAGFGVIFDNGAVAHPSDSTESIMYLLMFLLARARPLRVSCHAAIWSLAK